MWVNALHLVKLAEKGVNVAVKHTFITKDGFKKTKTLTGMSAIREKCLECCCWNSAEVRRCPAKDCALHPFRFGRGPKNPNGELKT